MPKFVRRIAGLLAALTLAFVGLFLTVDTASASGACGSTPYANSMPGSKPVTCKKSTPKPVHHTPKHHTPKVHHRTPKVYHTPSTPRYTPPVTHRTVTPAKPKVHIKKQHAKPNPCQVAAERYTKNLKKAKKLAFAEGYAKGVAAQKAKDAAASKIQVASSTQAAKDSLVCVNDYQFPWILVGAAVAAALLLGAFGGRVTKKNRCP